MFFKTFDNFSFTDLNSKILKKNLFKRVFEVIKLTISFVVLS